MRTCFFTAIRAERRPGLARPGDGHPARRLWAEALRRHQRDVLGRALGIGPNPLPERFRRALARCSMWVECDMA